MKARKRKLPVLNPGPIVTCDRLRSRLSTAACVLRWRAANSNKPRRVHSSGAVDDMREAVRLTPCKRCEVGRTRNQERTGR